MRPLLLRVQAFGPFAGSELVDFRPLGARALFLIHGPTGAGKTSLLDALCFALYGESSGEEREPRSLRSDRAAAGLPTEVELQFELDGRRYRVERAPAQPRPRQRGSGSVESPASASLDLWRATGWQPLAIQPGRVTARVEELLGFSCGQFRQVILLPQGRFRELLVARSSEREAILEQLFQTSLYSAITEALKEQARALQQQARAAREQRGAVLASLELPADADPAERIAELAAQLAEAQRAIEAARTRRTEAAAALQAGEAISARRKALEQAGIRLAGVLAHTPQREQWQVRLRRSSQAGAARAPLESWQQAMRLHQQAGAELALGRQRLESARAVHQAARERLDLALAAAGQTARLQRERLALDQVEAPLTRLDMLHAEFAGVTDVLAGLERDIAAAEAALEQARAELEALNAARAGASDAARQAAELARRLDLAEQRERREGQLAAARMALQEAHDKTAAAARQAQQCGAQHEDALAQLGALESQWRSGQAARLALGMKPGEACPVCGSTSHPSPAHRHTEVVSDETLARSRQQVELRDRQARAAHAAEVAASADQRAAQAAADAAAAELAALLAEPADSASLRAHWKALSAEAARLDALDAALPLANARRKQQGAVLTGLQPRHQLAREQCVRLQQEATTLERQLPADLRSAGALALRRAQLEAQLGALEQEQRAAGDAERAAAAALEQATALARDTHQRLERAAAELATAQAQGQQILAAHGLADLAAWQQALLPAAEVERLEQAVQAHDRAEAAARAELARCEGEAGQAAEPELALLRAADQAAAAALELASTRLGALSSQHQAAQRGAAQVAFLDAELRDLDARHAVAGRLSEVAKGDNPQRLTLQRYVLATLLDEVLEAASQRLLRMSRQRYVLRRLIGVADARSAGGLDLEVLDGETGVARPVATLSGGEGFLAALSLALGLAEVVQSRSGGIHLDTLFVDEGFGTLDPEALDVAIGTLIDLQREGRLVGIISHVAELRERIDVRLELRSGAGGSRASWTLPVADAPAD